MLGKCGTKGGQVTVAANPNDAAYNTASYVASGAKPKDVIIRLAWEDPL